MLEEKVYERLSRLVLAMPHKSSLNMAGSRKSLHKGIAAEFSDFREYMPGDDLRRLDWNVYARLDRMYIREYMEEKEAVVNVILDTSASMDFGKEKKSDLAVDLAAVMAYLSLQSMDRVILYDMKEMHRPFPVGGGKNTFARVLQWLEGRGFTGSCDMLASLKRMQRRGAGITVIISDFLHSSTMEEEGAALGKVLNYLSYCRQKPILLQTLCAEELRVDMDGTRNLIDMETGRKLRITMDASAIRSYEEELHRFCRILEQGARRAQGSYVLCDTEKDRNHLIFEDLRVLYDI